MKFLNYLLICLMIFSCENTKHEKNIAEPVTKPTKIETDNDIFKVIISLKSVEDEKFQILYVADSPTGKYKPENRLQFTSKGQQDLQTLTFEFPEGIIPYKFRIDLGELGNETSLIIQSIKMKLNDNEILIDSSTMSRYFQKNIYVETTNWQSFERKKFSGKYDPFLTSKEFLIKKIQLEL